MSYFGFGKPAHNQSPRARAIGKLTGTRRRYTLALWAVWLVNLAVALAFLFPVRVCHDLFRSDACYAIFKDPPLQPEIYIAVFIVAPLMWFKGNRQNAVAELMPMTRDEIEDGTRSFNAGGAIEGSDLDDALGSD